MNHARILLTGLLLATAACSAPPTETAADGQDPLSLGGITRYRGPRGADGVLLSVAYDANGYFTSASATDLTGVARAVTVSSAFVTADGSASTALRYTENGAEVLLVVFKTKPTDGYFQVHARSARTDLSYLVDEDLDVASQLGLVDAMIVDRSTGALSHTSGECDWSQSFCPAPALYVYFGGELARLAYFDSVIQGSLSLATGQAQAADAAAGIDASAAHAGSCNLSQVAQKASGFATALFAGQITACTTPTSCALLPWLGTEAAIPWQARGLTVFPPCSGGDPAQAARSCYETPSMAKAGACWPG